jgi:hypothetical protein
MRSFDCGVLICVGWVWFALDGVGAIGKRTQKAESSRLSSERERERERPRKRYGDKRVAETERERREIESARFGSS